MLRLCPAGGRGPTRGDTWSCPSGAAPLTSSLPQEGMEGSWSRDPMCGWWKWPRDGEMPAEHRDVLVLLPTRERLRLVVGVSAEESRVGDSRGTAGAMG